MIYLYFNQKEVQILALKKTLLGQQELSFFNKRYEANLLEDTEIKNIDFLASAIKEGLNLATPQAINEKNVTLILPQKFFFFLKTEVPTDVASSAIDNFVKDKAKSLSSINFEEAISNYLELDNQKQKTILFYAIEKRILQKIEQALALLDLKIENIIPQTLAYFKLFEKTLRKEKKEIILYASYQRDNLFGYLYDNYGLINNKEIRLEILEKSIEIEFSLKEKISSIEKEEKIKINRIILAGEESENIRQDTFTKTVGVWTNPLKRIIINFYKDYLDKLIVSQEKSLSILNYAECFGGFIFNEENGIFLNIKGKTFNKASSLSAKKMTQPFIFRKEIFIFAVSFLASFIFFMVISNIDSFNTNKLLVLKKVTPTLSPKPTFTPTPTPNFSKKDLKIKVLNGSGIKGKAAEVKDILKEKGYGEIITDNADNFDYKKTEINAKKDKSQAALQVKDDLKDYVTSVKIGELKENEIADLVIIIATDFK